MCDAAAAGMGVLSGVQNIFSAKSQAQDQYQAEMASYNNSMANWEINKMQQEDRARMLNANAILQMQQAYAAQQEANESAAEQKSEIAREMMRARAQAELAAGEAGVNGKSVDRILADINFTEQSKLAAVESTRENVVSQAQMEKHNIRQTAQQVPIYAAIGSKPKYQGNSASMYLSAALSGFSTYAGATYNARTAAASSNKVSQCSSKVVRNPVNLCNPCGR